MSNQFFSNQHTHTQPTPYLAPTTVGTSTTSYTYSTDPGISQYLSQVYTQQYVQQQLNKHTYIFGNKLYINGLDVVRLV